MGVVSRVVVSIFKNFKMPVHFQIILDNGNCKTGFKLQICQPFYFLPTSSEGKRKVIRLGFFVYLFHMQEFQKC